MLRRLWEFPGFFLRLAELARWISRRERFSSLTAFVWAKRATAARPGRCCTADGEGLRPAARAGPSRRTPCHQRPIARGGLVGPLRRGGQSKREHIAAAQDAWAWRAG